MQSPFRFGSFAPERKECRATWFVDGKTYFEHLADSLEAAQHQIFITDWSLNPEVYLRRTQPVSSANRLDKILKRKAEEGVEIFVLLWFETASATKGTVNSMHAISKLRELHPTNIHALRHPGGRMKVMWTHHQKTVIIDQRIAYVGGIDLCFGRYDHQHHPLVDDCELALEFPGKDYYNPRFDDFHDLHRPFQDLLDRATQPRMPWHDIHSYIDGEAAVDVAQNFIVRWNHHLGKARRKDPSITSPEIHELPRYEENVMNKRGTCRVQIVRSLSQWSSGLPYKEASVHAAYVSLIENAHHFIYIENQYFISAENQVAVTLRERIARAISNKEVFRAYICVPITPCGQWESTSIKYVMKWQYKTINKDILNPLRERFPGVPVNDYVSFYSFRTAARLGNQVVSDQVYIHSKLMIVDDRVAVIGSANINDRSLCGDRDSEIVAIIEDEEYVESQMNGNFYLASRFAHSLRVSLFSEHLGLLSDDGTIENRSELLNQINDPICEDTFKFWGATALSNKRIFDTLCPDAPRDGIDSFALLRQIREMEPAPFEKRLELLSKLRGHLITYPLLFLQNDTFEERGVVVENIVPDYVFQ